MVNKNSQKNPKKENKISKKDSNGDVSDISLYNAPLRTLYCFIMVVLDFLWYCLGLLKKNILIIAFLVGLVTVPHFVKGPHSDFVEDIDQFLIFAGWWIGLGILSSVGLGTGLHTFILYLGPHIANLTIAAYECNGIPNMLPSRFNFQKFDLCPKNNGETVTFLQILFAVQLEAALWGVGTAIGELPPYIVAKAARLAGSKDEELAELDNKSDNSFMTKAKRLLYNLLQRHAFLTVLIAASIPNPLFDLAGLTCGHFLIPFHIFFIATCIGKAFFKVHLQMLFIIFSFSKYNVEKTLKFLNSISPWIGEKLEMVIEKQRIALRSDNSTNEGSESG